MSGALIVTGASRGIGAAIAKAAGHEGWSVCVNYNQSKEPAEAVAAEIEAAGAKAIVVQGDMSRAEDIERVFETSDRELGPLGGLVNNAGIITGIGRLDSFSYDQIHRIFEVNSVGPVYCCRLAVERMSTKHGGKGGAIVNIASAASTMGSANEFIHYAASKAALDALTYGLSKEVAMEGVRVNAVSPGYIESDIHYEGRWEKLKSAIPMGRQGKGDEVAQPVLFLLSDKASYVTGAILRIAGGR